MFQLTKEEVKSIFQRLDRLDRKQMENEQKFEKVFAKFEENEPRRQGILIDEMVYHFGASIKDLGKKWFAVSLMKEYTPEELLNRL